VTTGDLDGDGLIDIIAGNWGLNHKYRCGPGRPQTVFYGDLDGDGAVDIVEAYFDPGMGKEVPERGLQVTAAAMPFVGAKFNSFESYANASVQQIYGEQLDQANRLDVTKLASMVFYNRGARFERVRLPTKAQFAPAFACCAGDFDGDGHEDIFLGQNFLGMLPEVSRADAGRSLWLRGLGQGVLQEVEGHESGLLVYGEQRGVALCEYDADGRLDIAVSQNGATTKLFRNIGAKPGLRVRLKGPQGNPCGIGATLRLGFEQGMGAARQIHAGSGYWSQDSAVQVMATPQTPIQIWIRWPGGRTTTSAVPIGAREINVDLAGHVERVR
jgi:hypothetical protein